MSEGMVSVEDFAASARSWISENLPPVHPLTGELFSSIAISEADKNWRIQQNRDLQRRLFDGGYAGICVPKDYGGQGLTAAHQAAFNKEIAGYDYPAEIQASTFIPCMALLLEFGTEEQKQRHIPAMLRGEEIWVQFLSEPGGGSDAAGATTTAQRDGDAWRLNGSKIWTTAATYGDWAICLARTNWDAPKHRGLTVFSVPLTAAGIDVREIELLNGSREFCQEYLTDVAVPDIDRIGDVDDGWTVVTRWLYHERTIAGGSPYVTGAGSRPDEGPYDPHALIGLARDLGTIDDSLTRTRIGEAAMLALVRRALATSVTTKMATGALPHHAAAMIRLFGGTMNTRRATIAAEICGPRSAVWADSEGAGAKHSELGLGYLVRQVACIGGGTTEMARNVISERLLGMPREARNDAGPFRDVPRGPRATEG
jgi:alkylation response protein AidB-like acyl-CoA dehydrogenase